MNVYREPDAPQQKWEHTAVEVSCLDMHEQLDRKSVNGWELVAVIGEKHSCILFFKRMV